MSAEKVDSAVQHGSSSTSSGVDVSTQKATTRRARSSGVAESSESSQLAKRSKSSGVSAAMYSGAPRRLRRSDGVPCVMLTESQIRHLPGIPDFYIKLLLTNPKSGELLSKGYIEYYLVDEHYVKKFAGEDALSPNEGGGE